MVSTIIQYAATILLIGVFAVVLSLLVRRYRRLRGVRVVTCPASKTPAAVEVNALQAALSGSKTPELHLSSCTYWPERKGCGEGCLREIESSPEGCLIRNILGRWFSGKTCRICGKPFGEIDWLEHRPTLMRPDGITEEWSRIQPLQLYAALETCHPVCWDCHIAATFRREHPELVTDRPWNR